MLTLSLIRNWKKIALGAWSSRLMVLAGLLTGLEAALPLLGGLLPIPPGLFAVASFLTCGGAFIARIVVQKGLDDEDEN